MIHYNNDLTSASIFHGIGGMSIGAERAGFSSIYATDKMEAAEKAFHLNKHKGVFQLKDILSLDFAAIKQFIHENNFVEFKQRMLDLFLSGSPCVGISIRNPSRHWLNDTNFMMHTQIRLAGMDGFQSKVAWFEQVDSFMDKPMRKLRREVIARLRAQSDYYFDMKVLNSADHKGTQSRNRTTIIMVRKDIGEPSFPSPQVIDYSKVSVNSLLPTIRAFRADSKKPGKSAYNNLCCTLTASGSEEVMEIGQEIFRKMTNEERTILSDMVGVNLQGIKEDAKKRLLGNMVQPAFAEAICRHIREQILKR
jgi:site-specific DNA-cytosine methylase